MSDPSIVWQNVTYNQPPHLSCDLQSRLSMSPSLPRVTSVAAAAR